MKLQRFTVRGLRSAAAMVAVGLVVSACAGAAPDASPGSADSVVGTWGDTGASEPHLVLASDGSVTGTDGCNGIATTFAVDGTSVEFESFMSTFKACEGVDTWLSAVHSAEVDGDEMIVSNASGDRIGTLKRTAG
jgi:heat shock protein HslJ